jgi:hypothetical protein
VKSLDEINRDRLLFLRKLYDLSEGNQDKIFYIWSIGEQLGFSGEYTTNISQYLEGEGLIKFRILGGGVSITHKGVILAEKAQPDTTTHIEAQSAEQMPQRRDIDGDKGIQKLQEKIDEESWKFFEMRTCLVMFPDNRWMLTLLRIELLSDKTDRLDKKLENEDLKIIREIRPIDSLNDVISEVVHERKLTIGKITAYAELTDGEWSYEVKLRSQALDELQIDYPCYFASTQGNYPKEMAQIERKFRESLPLLANGPYMSLSHACKLLLNVEHGIAAYGISYQVIAPIQAKLENIQFDDMKIVLDLHSHKHLLGQLKVVLFGLNQDGSPNEYRKTIDKFEGKKEIDSYSKELVSDHESMSLIVKVFYKTTLIEEVQAEKWRIEDVGLKLLVERIDPDLQILGSWLEGKNLSEGKYLSKQAEKFERAVSILFFLCNLRSAHVGGDYEEDSKQIRRSKYTKTSVNTDVLSVTPDNCIIFVCQCTVDWNIDKVASVLDIANELKGWLPGKKKPLIQPVIITQVGSETITDNLKKAEERMVKVVTIESLRVLIDEIRQNKVPYKIAMNILSLK